MPALRLAVSDFHLPVFRFGGRSCHSVLNTRCRGVARGRESLSRSRSNSRRIVVNTVLGLFKESPALESQGHKSLLQTSQARCQAAPTPASYKTQTPLDQPHGGPVMSLELSNSGRVCPPYVF